MSGISKFQADELAETWELTADTGSGLNSGQRQTLRECADTIRMLASLEIETARWQLSVPASRYGPPRTMTKPDLLSEAREIFEDDEVRRLSSPWLSARRFADVRDHYILAVEARRARAQAMGEEGS